MDMTVEGGPGHLMTGGDDGPPEALHVSPRGQRLADFLVEEILVLWW